MMLPNSGFGMGQNFMQLPVPADQLIRQPINIDVNHPPFIPQVQCPQEIQQFLPFLTGSLIQITQNSAQSNNPRAFAFNVLSENNYYNQEFQSLAMMAVMILMVFVYERRQTNDMQGLLSFVANKACELYVATKIAQYQQLQGYLNAEQAQGIQQLLQEMESYKNSFSNLSRQMQYGSGGFGQFQNARPGFSQGGMNAGFGNAQAPNRYTGSSVFSQSQPSIAPVIHSDQAPNRYTTKSAAPAFVGVALSNNPPNNPSSVIKPFNEEAKMVADTKLLEQPVSYKNSTLVWSASDHQYYPPITQLKTHEIQIVKEDGIPTLKINPKSDDAMFDYEAHTAYSSLRVYPGNQPRIDAARIHEANEHLERIVDGGAQKLDLEKEELEIPQFQVATYPDAVLRPSLEAILFRSHVVQCLAQGKSKIDVEDFPIFHVNGILLSNLGILEAEERDEILLMRRALSFDEILMRFKANTEILSKCTWNLLEKRFTKLLNETLRLQLSLDMHIDSFFTDYEALKGVLKAKSETIFNALESHAKEFIKYALNLLYQGEMYDLAISEYASESEGDDAVPFTFLQNNVEILRLPVSAEELNIDVYKDLGSLILQSESKSLYKIAHFLEDMEKGYENNTFTNRYVVTNDGVVLRLTKGLVGEGNFTVSVLDL